MLCITCLYNNDRSHCETPNFGNVVECTGYASEERYKSYIIPYNFLLNTRKGFKTIYHLMRLSQHDMTTVIKDIIKVRREGINVIIDACNKVEKENNDIIKFLYGGA